MGTVQDHTAFYAQNYNVAGHWLLRTDSRIVLGDKEMRVCRFCGRTKPDVTFHMDAHALPESVGNKGLLTYYECDECNQAFGQGCENDFGNWTLPMRTFARVSGKSGIPSIKQGPANAWRIDQNPTGLKINVEETEGFYNDDPVAKTLTFRLKRPAYRPAKVAQAFFKMALSVMPDAELHNFRLLLDWMKPGTLQRMAAATPIIHTFVGGAWERDLVRVALLVRMSDEAALPYCFFILGFGNEMFQVAIPSTEKDNQLYGSKLSISTFPFCGNEEAVQTSRVQNLNLHSDEWVRDDVVEIGLSYGNRVDRDASATE